MGSRAAAFGIGVVIVSSGIRLESERRR